MSKLCELVKFFSCRKLNNNLLVKVDSLLFRNCLSKSSNADSASILCWCSFIEAKRCRMRSAFSVKEQVFKFLGSKPQKKWRRKPWSLLKWYFWTAVSLFISKVASLRDSIRLIASSAPSVRSERVLAKKSFIFWKDRKGSKMGVTYSFWRPLWATTPRW